jgi:hypothetical protein
MQRKTFGPYLYDDGSVCKGLFWVNGRLVNINRITSIVKDRPGFYTITTSHIGTFKVGGGRHGGGRVNEWYVQGGVFGDSHIRCSGLVDAIKLIEGC